MSLRWSSIGHADVDAWCQLTNVLGDVDGTDEYYASEALAEELDEFGFDPALDSWAVWSDDRLVGYGQMRVSRALADGRVRAFLSGGVHPDFRGQGIGGELLRRFEERAPVKARELFPGVDITLRVPGGVDGSRGADVRPLLERCGYDIARYFRALERPLPGPALDDPRADGVTIRSFGPDVIEPTRLACNDSFSTHWGSAPAMPELWQQDVASTTFRSSTSFVAVDNNGEVQSFCLTNQYVDGELYVHLVGTRRAARGRGLARACLTESIRHAVAEGTYDKVGLSVDAANPDGALGLYESTGFHLARSYVAYQKVVPPLEPLPA